VGGGGSETGPCLMSPILTDVLLKMAIPVGLLNHFFQCTASHFASPLFSPIFPLINIFLWSSTCLRIPFFSETVFQFSPVHPVFFSPFVFFF